MSQSLEPKDGDFVAYLQELEAGRVKELKGLSIQAPAESGSGMLTVTRLGQKAEPLEAPAPFSRERGLPAALLTTAGSVMLALGAFVLIFALAVPELLNATPVGMFLVFFGIVATAEGKKRRKKELRRQEPRGSDGAN